MSEGVSLSGEILFGNVHGGIVPRKIQHFGLFQFMTVLLKYLSLLLIQDIGQKN